MRLMADFAKVSPQNLDFCNQLAQYVGDQKSAAASVTGAQPSAAALAFAGTGDVAMPAAASTFNFGVAPQTQSPQSFLGPIATLSVQQGRGRPDMGRGRSSSHPPQRAKRSTSRSAAREAQGTTSSANKVPDVLEQVDAALSATSSVGVAVAQTAIAGATPASGAPILDLVGGALGLSAPILGQQSG